MSDFKTLQDIVDNLEKVGSFLAKADEHGVEIAIRLAETRLHNTIRELKYTQSVVKDYLEYVQTYEGRYPNDHTPKTIEEFYDEDWGTWGA